MHVVAGVDIGSAAVKTVILNQGDKILSHSIVEQGIVNADSALFSLEQALDRTRISLDKVEKIVTTGYGRELVAFEHESITEISCHAAGAFFLMPEVRTVVDIGGQDSKVITLDENGRVRNFQMNDKCAAGTGKFIEVMARALDMSVTQMGELASGSQNPCHVSSVCTVFAESEIISLAAKGFPKDDIIAGLYESIARRTQSLMSPMEVVPVVMMTGGVAKNKPLVAMLERVISKTVIVPDEPQIVGALGDALFARQKQQNL
jgi:predicted CoA-substrate-specific enzyme activase